MTCEETDKIAEGTLAEAASSFLTEEELALLDGQEPPIIIKPGPGGGFDITDVIQMGWLRRVETDFPGDPTLVPGTSGHPDRWVYTRATARVTKITICVGNSIAHIEVPQGASYFIGIDY
ncbi:MAG TPA: hypothetical protein VN937_27600 [Blastocatellia bacterium]|nr:hypothetical protein [Blastocatellia bacterium]